MAKSAKPSRAQRPAPDQPATSAPAGRLPPVVLMAGEDRHAMLEHTAKLRAALAALHGEVQTVALDGAQAAMADVLDELRSVGLMVATKLVIVENTEALLRADDAPSGTKTPRELLEYYCKAPEPTSWLVLRVGSGKWIPGKLPDAIKSCGGRVENFAPQTPQDAQAWAVDRARNHHKVPIDLSAAQQLVEQVGVEQGRLDCELAKLAITALVRGQASITAELVAEMSGQTREDEVWAVQSCVLQDDAARVLAGLQDLVVISRHTPASLSWAMVDLARKLDGFARGAAAKENPFATGGRVKAFGAGRALVEKFGPRLSPVTTGALLASAVRCDAMNKSGRGDPARNIEVMALRFVAAVRQAAR